MEKYLPGGNRKRLIYAFFNALEDQMVQCSLTLNSGSCLPTRYRNILIFINSTGEGGVYKPDWCCSVFFFLLETLFQILLSDCKETAIYVTGGEFYYVKCWRAEQNRKRLDKGNKENGEIKKVGNHVVENKFCFRYMPVEEENVSSSLNNG